MKYPNVHACNFLFCIGLNHEKSNAKMRGKYSLSVKVQEELYLEAARMKNMGEIFIISTCNRTEVYGFVQHAVQLIRLLCNHTEGDIKEFQEVCYIHKNQNAINHLFRVGAGLNSQVLGDFEIIGQIKKSFRLGKKHNLSNTFFERLINAVILASKRIKNETRLSSGATSVAYASVQYIINNVHHIATKNILLFGAGKIGGNICENLVKQTKSSSITLINRSNIKAEKISKKFKIHTKSYIELQAEINKSDILIVATGAERPTISKSMISTDNPLLILDLSVPKNVSEDVSYLQNVRVCDLDYLSQITDKTIAIRKREVPKAELIIEQVSDEFMMWLETRKHVPLIKTLKRKLEQIRFEQIKMHKEINLDFNEEGTTVMSDKIIKQITSHFATYLKRTHVQKNKSADSILSFYHLDKMLHE